MRRFFWLVSGIVLVLAISLALLLLLAARLNPWLARRFAGSALAAGVLLMFYDLAVVAMKRSDG